MNFVIGLHKELGIEIPDADVSKLITFNGCVGYLMAKGAKCQISTDGQQRR